MRRMRLLNGVRAVREDFGMTVAALLEQMCAPFGTAAWQLKSLLSANS
jgi:hypothetical protein